MKPSEARSDFVVDCRGLAARDELPDLRGVGNGITALAQPTEAIGASAFDCLLKRLRGDDGPVRTLDYPAQLIVRGSTQLSRSPRSSGTRH